MNSLHNYSGVQTGLDWNMTDSRSDWKFVMLRTSSAAWTYSRPPWIARHCKIQARGCRKQTQHELRHQVFLRPRGISICVAKIALRKTAVQSLELRYSARQGSNEHDSFWYYVADRLTRPSLSEIGFVKFTMQQRKFGIILQFRHLY